MIPEALINVFQYIDTFRGKMINDLKEAVGIKSISGSSEHSKDILKMINWTEGWLKKLNVKYECFDIGNYEADGKIIKLPLVILATIGNDPKKKTVCAYSRLDVKNADSKQWKSDPWKLEERNKRLYGRGTCKGKGTLLSWFHCIEAFQKQNVKLPVNLKLIIEGMFEMGSFGMEQFLYTQRLTFIKNIDYICVCESEWINTTLPCLSYATVGICQYEIVCASLEGSHDAKKILEFIFTNCVDNLGNILIPNVKDDVLQITPDGEQSYETIRCDLSLIKKNLPEFMQNWDQRKILMRLWQFPSILCDEPEEVSCTCDNSGGSAKGWSRKMILKIVPVQTPDRCNKAVLQHIKKLCENQFLGKFTISCKITNENKKMVCSIKKGDKTELEISCTNTASSKPWKEDINSAHFQAARKAIVNVFKEEPNIIRESMDIAIIMILQKVVQKSNIVLMPLGNNEMDENDANECVIIRNYFESKKMLAAYLFEVAGIR